MHQTLILFNPRTYNVFLSLFKEDKTLALDVFSSCSFIPRIHFETSSVMASFYFYKMAAKMATIVGDVTGLQQRHHP